MQLWRGHPIIFAALLGATFGLANAVILALAAGPFSVMSSHVLLLLWPTSILAFGFLDGGSRAFVAFLVFSEFGGNALFYAFVLATPLCLFMAVHQSFNAPERPMSILRPKDRP